MTIVITTGQEVVVREACAGWEGDTGKAGEADGNIYSSTSLWVSRRRASGVEPDSRRAQRIEGGREPG